jgi:voltage-gated potassium channel
MGSTSSHTSSGIRRRRLRPARETAIMRYAKAMLTGTPLLRFVILLLVLWLLFSLGLYLAEQRVAEPAIASLGEALYWGVAAFSTAGIADTPASGLARLIGGTWIVVGSVIFFGIIIAAITGYFMRPMQRPVHRIVETIEYNLEHLHDLSVDELDLLRKTTDSLILHVESLKQRQSVTRPDAEPDA